MLFITRDVVVGLVAILFSVAYFSGFFRTKGSLAYDVTALLALRRALVGLNELEGWSDLETHRDPSTCKGVTVTGGRVTELNINSKGLSGSLPSEVGLLTALERFDCSRNTISGRLPSFATCVALKWLNCFDNGCTGPLPSFAACVALKILSCGENGFSECLPSFATCTALERLHCNKNKFSGKLPSFATCVALTQFGCGGNAFTNQFPSFAKNVKLERLSCSYNQFSGA
jgi:Leucine-rich repeat (LRR) protein